MPLATNCLLFASIYFLAQTGSQQISDQLTAFRLAKSTGIERDKEVASSHSSAPSDYVRRWVLRRVEPPPGDTDWRASKTERAFRGRRRRRETARKRSSALRENLDNLVSSSPWFEAALRPIWSGDTVEMTPQTRVLICSVRSEIRATDAKRRKQQRAMTNAGAVRPT